MSRSSTTTKSNLQYRSLSYYDGELSGCCGVFVAYEFSDPAYESDYTSYPRRKTVRPNEFETLGEQAQDVIKRIEDQARAGDYGCVLLTLVSEYGDESDNPGAAQHPELQETLEQAGYTVTEWIAPRHGNKLKMFMKLL